MYNKRIISASLEVNCIADIYFIGQPRLRSKNDWKLFSYR